MEQGAEEVPLGDPVYLMKKARLVGSSVLISDVFFQLLRKFNDLMLVVTLGDGETCPICWEGLELNECSRCGV